jgi:hypothetical protein
MLPLVFSFCTVCGPSAFEAQQHAVERQRELLETASSHDLFLNFEGDPEVPLCVGRWFREQAEALPLRVPDAGDARRAAPAGGAGGDARGAAGVEVVA